MKAMGVLLLVVMMMVAMTTANRCVDEPRSVPASSVPDQNCDDAFYYDSAAKRCKRYAEDVCPDPDGQNSFSGPYACPGECVVFEQCGEPPASDDVSNCGATYYYDAVNNKCHEYEGGACPMGGNTFFDYCACQEKCVREIYYYDEEENLCKIYEEGEEQIEGNHFCHIEDCERLIEIEQCDAPVRSDDTRECNYSYYYDAVTNSCGYYGTSCPTTGNLFESQCSCEAACVEREICEAVEACDELRDHCGQTFYYDAADNSCVEYGTEPVERGYKWRKGCCPLSGNTFVLAEACQSKCIK